jgi:hypothetical protein
MTRLILTTDDSGAGCLMQTGLADIVLPFGFRFAWGPLPSAGDLATLLATRSAKHDPAAPHWMDNFDGRLGEFHRKGLGLIELCQQCETVELWIDPEPNAQLMLIQLLDHFRSHGKATPKLTLVQADVVIGNHLPEEVAKWRLPAVKILNDHLQTASAA